MNNLEEFEYCRYCGKKVNKETVICPHCGSQLKILRTEIIKKSVITPKSKIIAILLAIFFSYWSWLYTYGKNSRKFWLSITIFFAILIFTIIYSCSAIFEETVISAPPISFAYIYWIYFIGVWLWPIIEYSIRPRSFYEKYPIG